ncbi:MAG: Cell division protein FtsZ 1 [Methanomassiliicoccales archaeon PtaU1.Bin124]|nr:MAG: Cell division protein FtsZ 1 [Methanomassiliicoccales archaeon PtaU1.Bin124]
MPSSLVKNALAGSKYQNGAAPAQAPQSQNAPEQQQYAPAPQATYNPAPQPAPQQPQYQQPAGNFAPAGPGMSTSDDELLRIAAQLDVCIKIIGCGGGGCNTINRCVDAGIQGAQLCAINTDAKHLLTVRAPRKILIGKSRTRGLGAGAKPEVGEESARENDMEIRDFLTNANIVFVTAGMGGGTGTGSAHYVANIAKSQIRALTIGVVTMPFKAEGTVRMENALAGLNKLRQVCDTTIVIPNDKLLELVPKLPVDAAFKVADEVLMQTIKGLTEIITKPGLVNLDYADIMTVMNEGGVAFVGIGEANTESDDRVKAAVHEALTSPMLGEVDLKEARGALIRVVGGPDMTVGEAQKAAEIVTGSVSPRARIIWGCSIDPELEGTIKILLIVTGAKSAYLMSSRGPTQQVPGQPMGQRPGQQQQQYQQRPQPQYQQPRGNDDDLDFVR